MLCFPCALTTGLRAQHFHPYFKIPISQTCANISVPRYGEGINVLSLELSHAAPELAGGLVKAKAFVQLMRAHHSLWELLPPLRRGTICQHWTPILCRCEDCCENTRQTEKINFSLIESQNVWDYRWRSVLLLSQLCLQGTSLLDLLFPVPLLEMSPPPERKEEQTKLLPAWKRHWQTDTGRQTEKGRFCQSKWFLWTSSLGNWTHGRMPGEALNLGDFTSIPHSWSPLWWFRCVHLLCGEMEYRIPEKIEN